MGKICVEGSFLSRGNKETGKLEPNQPSIHPSIFYKQPCYVHLGWGVMNAGKQVRREGGPSVVQHGTEQLV